MLSPDYVHCSCLRGVNIECARDMAALFRGVSRARISSSQHPQSRDSVEPASDGEPAEGHAAGPGGVAKERGAGGWWVAGAVGAGFAPQYTTYVTPPRWAVSKLW